MLQHFTAALEAHRSTMDYDQYWRYAKAKRIPRVILWLVENPDLAEALAQDARDLQERKEEDTHGIAPARGAAEG